MSGSATSTGVNFGAGIGFVRRFGVSLRISRRAIFVSLALLALCAVLAIFACTLGDFPLSVADVWAVITGQQGGLPRSIVLNWRMPRIAAAVVLGSGLALAGLLFQTLTHNPLGSPDVIGFNTGAYTGALIMIITAGGSFALVTIGALAGGLATAAVVTLLAYRGGLAGLRLIITGIGIGAALAAINHWIILRAAIEVAMSAAVWGAGSLNGIRWPQAVPGMIMIAVLTLGTAAVMPRLRVLELGDDSAAALGISVNRTKIVMVALGVCLVAVVTAVAGPIAFISLVAPQLARRLIGQGLPGWLPTAAMGGLLLLAGDIVAQRLLAPIQLPVGIVTVCLGGGYLIWLLVKETRR